MLTVVRCSRLVCLWNYVKRGVHVLTDPENTGDKQSGTNFDTLGTWNNRLTMEVMVEESIRRGQPIPHVKLEQAGCSSLIGRRTDNEDRIVMKQLPLSGMEMLYFGIFDGHGGPHAADFACQQLEKHVVHWCNLGKRNLEEVLQRSFVGVNNAYARHVSLSNNEEGYNSGTTATVCLLRNSIEVVIGHVGDSRALLSRRGQAKRLSVDHSPDDQNEVKRLSKHGAHVTTNSIGTMLVNGRLAMTRSIGDLELKYFGVQAAPQTCSLLIKHGKDAFLTLTTDGINFVMNDDEICETINRCEEPDEAAHFLVDQALQYGSDDNATAIVIPFGAWGKYASALTNIHNQRFTRWASSSYV